MKYLLNYYRGFPGATRYNAESKAKLDVIRTFEKAGYSMYDIYKKHINIKFLRTATELIFLQFQMLRAKKQFNSDDIVYIQYPGSCMQIQILLKELKSRGAKVCMLVHDISSFRFGKKVDIEVKWLNVADELLVHTEAMKNLLTDYGVKTPMRIMELFDYYTDDPFNEKSEILKRKNIVLFAGNLDKSIFLRTFVNTPTNSLKYNYYGVEPSFQMGEGHFYKGKFAPENVSAIEGGWGLVWDGDSITTCSGVLGEYLRYNASHKASLYLAAGIPLIVWNKSGIAQWVRENNLGIAIGSLEEMEQVINNISEADYLKLLESAHQMGEKLRKGEMLRRLL